MRNLRDEVKSLQCDMKLRKRMYCSKEEAREYDQLLKDGKRLPDEIYVDEENNEEYYRYSHLEYTENELKEYIMLTHVKCMRTIKNCMVYFVTISVIVIILSILFSFSY